MRAAAGRSALRRVPPRHPGAAAGASSLGDKVYGVHAVRALLLRHAARVTSVTIAEGREPRVLEIQTLAQKAGKAVKRAPAATFKQLFGDAVHQGVYAEVEPLPPWQEEALVAAITARLEARE